ncbi:MAG: hypothetical protein IIC82_00205, partial [Chloroflexi bacterium]|nr:hypothetical protein [Chloroflexota bacterium]
EQAVELSARYIPGRVQPDKSIDVIDEAGARLRLKSMTKPPNLSQIEKEIDHLLMEDHLHDGAGSQAAIFLGPTDADPLFRAQLPTEYHGVIEVLIAEVVAMRQAFGQLPLNEL